MMQEHELIINDEDIEIAEVDFPIDLAISDINEINLKKPFKTGMLHIPATKNNLKNLGNLVDINSSTSIDNLIAKLTIRNAFRLKGKVKQYDTIRTSKGVFLPIQLIGGIGDLVKDLELLMMTDLDMSVLDHSYTEAIINVSETAGLGYLYPLINYGEFLNEDEVVVEDRLPAFRLIDLIEKIIEGVGYKIESTLLDSAAFGKWYMTFPKSPDIYTDEFKEENLYQAGVSDSDNYSHSITPGAGKTLLLFNSNTDDNRIVKFNNVTGDNFNNGSNYSITTYKFTAASVGSYRFQSSISLTLNWNAVIEDVNITVLKIELLKNGSSIKSDDQPFITWVDETFIDRTLTVNSGYQTFQAADYFEIRITVTGTANNTSGTNRTVNLLVHNNSDTYFKDLILLRPAKNYSWVMSDWLPDMTQKEFLKQALQLFNVMIAPNNEERVLYIEDYDSFFSNDKNDLSDYVDKGSNISFKKKEIPSFIRLMFNIDANDSMITNYARVATLSEGNGKTEDHINELFSLALMGVCREIGFDTNEIPKLWNKSLEYPEVPEQYMNFKPRLLYYDGQTAVQSGEQWIFEDSAMSNYTKFTSYDAEHFMDTYWKGLLNKKNNAKLLKLNIYFNDNFISNLINCVSGKDFRSTVFIDKNNFHGSYTINKISAYKSGKGTTVELLQHRVLQEGVTYSNSLIEGTGKSGGGGGGSSTTTPTTTTSFLITDSAVISEITSEASWSGRDYIGSLAGLSEGNYYVQKSKNIAFKYDGSNLLRYSINNLIT